MSVVSFYLSYSLCRFIFFLGCLLLALLFNTFTRMLFLSFSKRRQHFREKIFVASIDFFYSQNLIIHLVTWRFCEFLVYCRVVALKIENSRIFSFARKINFQHWIANSAVGRSRAATIKSNNERSSFRSLQQIFNNKVDLAENYFQA